MVLEGGSEEARVGAIDIAKQRGKKASSWQGITVRLVGLERKKKVRGEGPYGVGCRDAGRKTESAKPSGGFWGASFGGNKARQKTVARVKSCTT